MATANEKLLAGLINHQIGMVRVSNSMRRRMVSLLQKTEGEMKTQIVARTTQLTGQSGAGFRLDATANRKLARVEDSIKRTRSPGFANLLTELTSDLQEIAIEEPRFLRGLSMSSSMPIELDLNRPSASELRKIVTSRPFQGRVLKDWAKTMEADERRRIMNEIRIGLTQGQDVNSIVRRIVGTAELSGRDGVTARTRRDLQAVVRTAVNHISSSSAREFALANRHLFSKEIWVSVLDGVTSYICLSLNGRIFDVGKGLYPPVHYNALAGGTSIETDEGLVPIEHVRVGQNVLTHRGRMMPVTAVMSKPCDVDGILRIETASGNVILATDEHPVLTFGKGWKRADQIDVGDKLFENRKQDTRSEGDTCVVSHADDYPSPFEQPLIPYQVLTSPGSMATAINLNGDQMTTKSEVDRTGIDDQLVGDVDGIQKTHLFQDVYHGLFSLCDITRKRLGLGDSHSVIDLRITRRVLAAKHAFTMLLRKLVGFFWPLSTPMGVTAWPIDEFLTGFDALNLGSDSDALGLAEIGYFPRWDTEFAADVAKGTPLAPVLSSDNIVQGRRVDHWALSDVISITRLPHGSQLFNLAVDVDETYLAGGIIVHNCRSRRSPLISNTQIVHQKLPPTQRRALLQEFAERDGLGRIRSVSQLTPRQRRRFDGFSRQWLRDHVGGVPGVQSTEDFLGSMNQNELGDLLGVSKARLVRRGNLTIGKLVDRHGRPLTLQQLATKERQAFERAGISPDRL